MVRLSLGTRFRVKVLVTGAAGFIGSHTCERFVAAGNEVWGVDDLSTGRQENLSALSSTSEFHFEELDIAQPQVLDLVENVRPDVVIHLAAQMDVRRSVADPLTDARTNVLGTVNLLTAATQSRTTRVVFSSSGGTVYGEPESCPVAETAPLAPLSPYGAGKVAGEAYVAAFGGLYGMRYCNLALANVYGPRQDPHGEAGVVAIFARALLNDEQTWIYGDGNAVRDYVYIDDVVSAIELAATGKGDGQRYNIGTARGTTVRELHSLIAAAIGAPDAPGHRKARPGELQRVVLDVERARRHLAWTPTTELERGVCRTIEWIRAEDGGPMSRGLYRRPREQHDSLGQTGSGT